MRDEGPNLPEWIAHHLGAGIGHFLVYSNDCTDGTDHMLDELAAAGLVTHVRLRPGRARPVQWQALKDAARRPELADADWAVVFDCDEFVNLRAPDDGLAGMLAGLPPGTSALAMGWRLFGNSGHLRRPAGLTIEGFTRAAPPDIPLPLAHFCKSFFRPAHFREPGIHRPKRRQGALPRWCDGAGAPLPEPFARSNARINLFGLNPGHALVQLNHYSLRSAACFMAKRRRGLPNHTHRDVALGYWVERNFNDVEDTSILRMAAQTRAQLARLLEIGQLGALLRQAEEHHRAALEQQLRDEDENRLFLQLALAGDSRVPDAAFIASHLRRLKALNRKTNR